MGEKRGQIALYAIVGLLVVFSVLLLLWFKTNFFMFNPDEGDLEDVMNNIRESIDECLTEISTEPIIRIGMQGGYLYSEGGLYRRYNGSDINYLCFNMDGVGCRNRMLTKENMEEQLAEFFDDELSRCFNVQDFKKFGGFTIDAKQWKTSVEILPYEVVLNLNYPIVLKGKDGVEVKEDIFVSSQPFPLGFVYDIVTDVVNSEALGDFDPLIYMLFKKGKVRIEKKRSYPDKLYIINKADNSYIFQFFIQGEAS